jgi:hypothetical protein
LLTKGGLGYGFNSVKVSGFVLDSALLPWVDVEVSCVVDAAKFVAQVHDALGWVLEIFSDLLSISINPNIYFSFIPTQILFSTTLSLSLFS